VKEKLMNMISMPCSSVFLSHFSSSLQYACINPLHNRALDDGELSPACMVDAFRCLGKAARAALCAIARNLRLRSE
jgi:hypothetical protein